MTEQKLGDIKIVAHKFLGRFEGEDMDGAPLNRAMLEVTFTYDATATDQGVLHHLHKVLKHRNSDEA